MTALRDLVPCVERLEVFQPPIGLSNCDLCMYTEIDKEENLVGLTGTTRSTRRWSS